MELVSFPIHFLWRSHLTIVLKLTHLHYVLVVKSRQVIISAHTLSLLMINCSLQDTSEGTVAKSIAITALYTESNILIFLCIQNLFDHAIFGLLIYLLVSYCSLLPL